MVGEPFLVRARLASALLSLSVLAVACGGSPPVYEVPPGKLEALGARLPDAGRAVPAFALFSRRPLGEGELDALGDVAGVAAVAPLAVRKARVRVGGRAETLTVGATEPVAFRSVAPAVTREAEFVWVSLMAGDAVLTYEAARSLHFGRTNSIDASGLGRLQVGALAEIAPRPLVDVLVAQGANRDLGETRAAVLGARSGVTLDALARDLKALFPSARLRPLTPKGQRIVSETIVTGESDVAPAVAGLHPALAAAVDRLLQAAGGRVWVVSGYRDYTRQYQLWVGALEKYGDPETADNWVAPPGQSMHEHGLAVDLGGDLALAARLARELGLPLWRPMSWEPWHFELAGSRG